MANTPNLGIRIIEGDNGVKKEVWNDNYRRIDENALSARHAETKMHFEMWQADTDYSLLSTVRTDEIASFGVFVCTKAGRSASIPPKALGVGDVAVDGTVQWQLRQIGSTGGGTFEHEELEGRDQPDQHPMTAITGLEEELTSVKDEISKFDEKLEKKVDIVTGKDLSTNDFTDAYKEKLDNFAETASGELTYKNKTIVGGVVAWSANTSYLQGQLIKHNRLLYSAIADFTSGATFDDAKLEQALFGYVEDWQPATSYISGEVVIINGNSLARCQQAHTSGQQFGFDQAVYWVTIGGSTTTIMSWQPQTSYSVDNVVLYFDILYLCSIAHTSSDTFAKDMTIGSEKWRVLQGAVSGSINLNQFTRADVAAGTVYEIPIEPTTTFAFLPIEVLKFVPGKTGEVITVLNYSSGDAQDFTIDGEPATNNPWVVFDNSLSLKTVYPVVMGDSAPFGEGFIRTSEVVDFSVYKHVDSLSYT